MGMFSSDDAHPSRNDGLRRGRATYALAGLIGDSRRTGGMVRPIPGRTDSLFFGEVVRSARAVASAL